MLGLALVLPAAPSAAHPLTQTAEGTLRIAVVGATREPREPWEADALVAAITRYDPHAVVQTGGYVARGTPGEWRDWRDRWTTLGDRVVAVPDRRARLRDRSLARWRASGAGQDVQDLPGSSWSAGTLGTAGVRWRVVVLDTERDALGTRWLDERTWLPKVLGGGDYDHLIAITGRPLASLEQPGPTGSRAVHDLLEEIDNHVAPGKLLAVVSGGTRTNEILLHSGSFGEAHVIAGNGRVEARDLARRGRSPLPSVGEMALVDGFDAALQRASREAGVPESADIYPAEALPVRGWWKLELAGSDLSVAFVMEQPDGSYRETYRIAYTRTMGWVAAGGR